MWRCVLLVSGDLVSSCGFVTKPLMLLPIHTSPDRTHAQSGEKLLPELPNVISIFVGKLMMFKSSNKQIPWVLLLKQWVDVWNCVAPL